MTIVRAAKGDSDEREKGDLVMGARGSAPAREAHGHRHRDGESRPAIPTSHGTISRAPTRRSVTLFAGRPMQILLRPFRQRLGWSSGSRPFWPGAEHGPGPRDGRMPTSARSPPKLRRRAGRTAPPRGRRDPRLSYLPEGSVTPVLRREPVGAGGEPPGFGITCSRRRPLLRREGPPVFHFTQPARGRRVHKTHAARTPGAGEETFSPRGRRLGKIHGGVALWSRPGTLLARISAPILRLLQVRASHAAVERLAAVARGIESQPCAPAVSRRLRPAPASPSVGGLRSAAIVGDVIVRGNASPRCPAQCPRG